MREFRQTTEENGTKSNTIVNFNSFTRPMMMMMMIGGREGEEAFVVFRVDELKCMRKKKSTHIQLTNDLSLNGSGEKERWGEVTGKVETGSASPCSDRTSTETGKKAS